VSVLPRYPVFVPSKGRAHPARMTAQILLEDGVPFRLVVEPQEADAYRARFPDAELLVTPHRDEGLTVTRNFIRDVSESEGAERHWQIDDNIISFRRRYYRERIPINAGIALRVTEDFTDRYTNIGVSGLNYQAFVPRLQDAPPFWLNCHVYSTSLVWNRMPYRWRLRWNDDTDLCLQVLAGGLCTVALNVFCQQKIPTMRVPGGNTHEYREDDGRAKFARMLERQWPRVVTTDRRWGHPQHVVKGAWRGFRQPLIRRSDLDWDSLPPVDEYGMNLVPAEGRTIRSPSTQALFDRWHSEDRGGSGHPFDADHAPAGQGGGDER
jgi:TET-Associated Glycosyltransferase